MARLGKLPSEEEGMVIAVVRESKDRQTQPKRAKYRFEKPKLAFMALLLFSVLVFALNSPFARLKSPLHSSPAADNGIVLGNGATADAAGLAPYDAGTWHVIYWLLLAAALMPLELELRKDQ